MSGKTVVLLIALGAWTPSAIAQDTTLDVAALVTLHEAGVPSDELTRLIERYGMPSDLDATGIDRLKGVSFPKALLITPSRSAPKAPGILRGCRIPSCFVDCFAPRTGWTPTGARSGPSLGWPR